MHQSDVFAVTPSAAMLARCVSRGVLTQEDIDHASSRRSPAFSSHFHEAVQRIRAQGQLDQVQLEAELLQVERQNADVTHSFHLRRRFEALQDLCCHLQQLLQDQTGLSRRLMRPLGCTNLPLQAHLHSTVVDVVQMLLVAVETLEEKVDLVQNRISSRERLSQLNGSLDRLLAQAAQVHTLSRPDP